MSISKDNNMVEESGGNTRHHRPHNYKTRRYKKEKNEQSTAWQLPKLDFKNLFEMLNHDPTSTKSQKNLMINTVPQ